MADSTSSNALAPPGAGLPFLELWATRVLFYLFKVRNSDEDALAHFSREGRKLTAIFNHIPESRRSETVLIDRISGIEDSSRNWSAAMVLEHLAIVNFAIVDLLEALDAGTEYAEVRIAAVKPTPKNWEASLAAFEKSLQSYSQYASDNLPFTSTTKHNHPWLGPMNSHAWHCLAAVHHSIHKRQLKLIAANTPS